MNSFVTLIGENKAPMIVVYDFEKDSDDLIKTEVLAGGIDIYDTFGPTWQKIIDARCHKHAQEVRNAERNERFEERARQRDEAMDYCYGRSSHYETGRIYA